MFSARRARSSPWRTPGVHRGRPERLVLLLERGDQPVGFVGGRDAFAPAPARPVAAARCVGSLMSRLLAPVIRSKSRQSTWAEVTVPWTLLALSSSEPGADEPLKVGAARSRSWSARRARGSARRRRVSARSCVARLACMFARAVEDFSGFGHRDPGVASLGERHARWACAVGRCRRARASCAARRSPPASWGTSSGPSASRSLSRPMPPRSGRSRMRRRRLSRHRSEWRGRIPSGRRRPGGGVSADTAAAQHLDLRRERCVCLLVSELTIRVERRRGVGLGREPEGNGRICADSNPRRCFRRGRRFGRSVI